MPVSAWQPSSFGVSSCCRTSSLRPNYSWAVLGIHGPDPAFRDDDGTVDADVSKELLAFAAGQQSERAVLTALAGSRLLVPVVAVLTEQIDQPGTQRGTRQEPAARTPAREKASDMAMPTLIGFDGRRAIPAFTCVESMRAWQANARPLPVPASSVWQAAVVDACAVVIDVAGPVPLAVEGVRLASLAGGEAAPAPWSDADVHEVVSGVLAGQLAVAGFELRPGGAEHDLVIALTLSAERAGQDVTELGTAVGNTVMERLGGRLRRGIAIWLGGPGAPA
jgi:type III secretion system (T3SS) SseB-like protein